MKGRDAEMVPARLTRTVRTRVWYVAQWGPVKDRGSPASDPECFRTVRVDSQIEGFSVAEAGARCLNPLAPWTAGARVSKVVFPTEAAPVETDRWLFAYQEETGAVWVRV